MDEGEDLPAQEFQLLMKGVTGSTIWDSYIARKLVKALKWLRKHPEVAEKLLRTPEPPEPEPVDEEWSTRVQRYRSKEVQGDESSARQAAAQMAKDMNRPVYLYRRPKPESYTLVEVIHPQE